MSFRQRLVFFIILLGCTLGVAVTYIYTGSTDDEPFHRACGMEWWEHGTYTMQPLHPPLGRIVDATLPYWLDINDQHRRALAHESWRDTYIYKVLLSRLGVLPFYLFSCILVYRWSRHIYGDKAALWSLALYGTLASMTAHAGLATTDMVYTAMLLWSLFESVRWLGVPTTRQSVLVGISSGLALCSKFSTLAQWPAAMAVIFALLIVTNARQGRALIRLRKAHIKNSVLIILPLAAFMVALIYRFSLDAFWQGIIDGRQMNEIGFGVWFYEPIPHGGVWNFFPVVFFFKTPLPFFAALLIGSVALMRQRANAETFFPLCAAVGIMGVSMTSNINLGVRHVLPLYPLLTIPAGYGLAWSWQQGGWKRIACALLMLWQTEGFVRSYPETIAYFNELVGSHPERITLDSDYDWGQNMLLLNDALEARNVNEVYVCARRDGVANARMVVYADIKECPNERVSGWVAVARAYKLLHPDYFTWLDGHEAIQTVGKTMDLYYIPPE